MAEGLLYTLAVGIIERLGVGAVKKLGLLWSAKDLEKLKNMVTTIQAVLLDAEEQQVRNNAIKVWLEKLTDAFYEADDLLDDLSAEVLQQEIMTRDKKAKKVSIFFSKSNQIAYLLKTGPKIKAIIEKLDALADVKKFHLKERHTEIPVRNRRRDDTHFFVRAEEVFGRDGDQKAVLELLMDSNDEENVSILPIVGIGGLGKTTLAQLTFNLETIEKGFQLKMWVSVSDVFDVKKIVGKILESATNKKPEDVEMSTLISFLKTEIDGKKYLLVLDDVWNEDPEEWFKLKQLLMGGARGSKILVTTRSKMVAKIMYAGKPYLLEGLDKHESWSLFKQLAFGKGQLENLGIMSVGNEIVEKCSGVPLAIKTIGRLLYMRNPETEWLSFKDNELSRISQNENDILPTLKLSYNQLPPHLKQYFAYCSLFPKDHEIVKSKLINLWISQGYIKLSDQNQCLEDVGQEYFMDLLWRSFFQEAEIDWLGDVTSCKMHDLMHDLAISVAGPLVARLEYKADKVDKRTRHVAAGYFGDFSSFLTLVSRASGIRTFLLSSGYKLSNKLEHGAIYSSLKSLRTLDLHRIPYYFLTPNLFCKLMHLRYLDLSEIYRMKKLPDSLTRLQNLQTLILDGCSSLEEWPREFKRLVNLRHLDIGGCFNLTYMPCGLGQLTNLQSLSKFVVSSDSPSMHSGGLNELNGLNFLKGNLVIGNLERGKGVAGFDYKAANLKEKQHLCSLELTWDAKYRTDTKDTDIVVDEMKLEGLQPHPNLRKLALSGYRGVRFPSWLLSLTNLVELKLSWCNKLQSLPPLSRLPLLKRLSMNLFANMEYISSDSGDGNESSSSSSSLLAPVAFFPSLKELHLFDCLILKGGGGGSFVCSIHFLAFQNCLSSFALC